jgi:hypothetical protein
MSSWIDWQIVLQVQMMLKISIESLKVRENRKLAFYTIFIQIFFSQIIFSFS